MRTEPPASSSAAFNDGMASRYGKKRWVRGEGVQGILNTYYKLNARIHRYRNRKAVELECNIVFSIVISLALQQREYEAAQPPAPASPAPLAVAA